MIIILIIFTQKYKEKKATYGRTNLHLDQA